MAEADINITKQFSWKRILIPVILGLAGAGYLLFSSLNEERFVEVEAGQGEYVWVDQNSNGVPDFSDGKEFVRSSEGNYIRKNFKDMLREQTWSSNVLLALGLAVLTVIIRDGGYIYRIRFLTDKALSWRQSFRVIMLWEFASALTPSVVGGSGVAIFILNREGINLGKSTATVFVTALFDEAFYIITVPIILILLGTGVLFPETWAGSTLLFSSIEPLFYLGYGFIVFLTLTIVVSMLFFPHKFKRIVQRLFTLPILRRWLRKATKMGDDLIIASREIKGKKFGWWFKGFSVTYASWTARFLTLNFILMAFSDNVDHVLALGKQLVMWVIMLISPTPGSSGVAELALDSFFSDMFQAGVTLFLIAIIWRLLTYFLYLFIGVAIFPKWLKSTS
ncbi:MAG: flippase-like domain-containing protein [Flavobacteriales bacterium]|nr:flippase-like domain-containing protein [Flavobacteriales bacterium]